MSCNKRVCAIAGVPVASAARSKIKLTQGHLSDVISGGFFIIESQNHTLLPTVIICVLVVLQMPSKRRLRLRHRVASETLQSILHNAAFTGVDIRGS